MKKWAEMKFQKGDIVEYKFITGSITNDKIENKCGMGIVTGRKQILGVGLMYVVGGDKLFLFESELTLRKRHEY